MSKPPHFRRSPLLGTGRLFALVACALALTLAPAARAQLLYWDTNGSTAGSSADDVATGTWDDTTANWSTASDGTAATQAWSGGATAVLSAGANATGTFTVNATGTLSTAGLTFEEGDVTVSGGELSGPSAIDVASGVSATVGSVISGSQSLTKSGAGTLILSGANTYTGATTISAGILQMGNGATTGSLSTASAIVVDGTLAFNRSNLVTQGVDFANALTGGGQFVQQGSGTLLLLGTNTLGAGAVVNNGALQLGDGTHAATLQAGAGTNGDVGVAGDPNAGQDPARNGGAGGAGGSAFVVNSGGTLDLSSQTAIFAGTGGNGGQGAGLTGQSLRIPGAGGSGGAGGNAIVVNDGTLPNLPAQSTVTGGAGGNGGETGYTSMLDPPQTLANTGGNGGAGGTAVLLMPTSSWTSSGTLIGGAGGIAGRGFGTLSGGGGAGITFSQGGSLANFGTITGGDGGQGSDPPRVILTNYVGRPGGNGGSGVTFGASGSLTNSGVINGGVGGAGGESPTADPHVPNTGGRGGDGGTAVTFSAGGSLINSGTITGGLGGAGSSSNIPGANGSTGYAATFSGGAGTLTNQSGGAINGGVVFGNYANAVTLETGSTINGDLNLNTHTGSTLTLTGSGTATYSQAVTGVTTFTGSLIKSGSGTWTLDQAFTYTGGTIVSAGSLNLANPSGSALGTGDVTIESGAFLTGTGSFTGALTVDAGGTLAPGNSPGLMTIGSGSVFNGTVAMQLGGLVRGTDYDAIDVGGAGALTFGGALDLSLVNGFTPALGDSFDLFNFTTGTSGFDTLTLPTLAAGLAWDISGLYTTGTLMVAASAIPEPSTFAFVLGLCALAAGFTRRRRARALAAINTDRNRCLEFQTPKHYLDRRDLRAKNLRWLASAR